MALVFPRGAAGQVSRLSPEDWREDLRLMAAQMPALHKNLFHTMKREDFERAVRALDAEIPNLNEDQIIVRLAQIGALVQDGHSGLSLREGFPHIPVLFVQYPDGVYVRAAAPVYADAVGGRVLEVGGAAWQAAMARVNSVVSQDAENEGQRLAWAAKIYLTNTRVLHGLGLSNSGDAAEFLIEKKGQRKTFVMRAEEIKYPWWFDATPEGWVDARPSSAAVPLAYQHASEPYWFTPLPERRAIYFQFNAVMDGDGETLAEFSARLGASIERPDVDRLVIDLRNNSGGDNTRLRPLLVTLIRSKVNHRGGIYAIIGPTTYSAAQNFVNRLGNYAEPIFVGAPTSENVNSYGDPSVIKLPHSGLEMYVSHLWWQDEDPRDARTGTFPEIAAESTFQDYVEGRDPVLELALTVPTPPGIEEALTGELGRGPAAVLSKYQKFLGDPLHKYSQDVEARVNRLGYNMLAAKRVRDAIVIFEANVRTHPKSWNAWDSLGEGYDRAGERQHAVEAYRKSIALNPANINGKKILERLEKSK
jgi:hypothetical protein